MHTKISGFLNWNFLNQTEDFSSLSTAEQIQMVHSVAKQFQLLEETPNTVTWRLIPALIKQMEQKPRGFLTLWSRAGKEAAVAAREAFHFRLVTDTSGFLSGAVCNG